MNIKKSWIIIGVILVIVFILYRLFGGSYNNMVEYDETTITAWSNVENVYQRRADLIPNLVSTVKGYAAHEKETLENVIKARSEATKTTIDVGDLTPQKMAAFQKAQQGLSGALSRLLVTVERYPDLKADKGFLELQSQLEGTENRINVERNRFNDLAGAYNIFIQKIPTNIIANFADFNGMPLYKSDAGSENAPKIEF